MKTYSFFLVIIFSLLVFSANVLGQTAPDTLWTKKLTLPLYLYALEPAAFESTNDDGFVLCYYDSLYCYDNHGDPLWKKDFKSIIGDDLYHGNGIGCIKNVNDGFIIGSTFIKNDSTKGYGLIKTDYEGDTLWCEFYTKPQELPMSYHYLRPNWIEQTSDNGFIITANQSCGHLGTEFTCYYPYLIKTDSTGDTLWTKGYADYFGHTYYKILKVLETSDNEYILLGYSNGIIPDSARGAVIIKTDTIGIPLWNKSYSEVIYNSFDQTSDGGFILVGSGDDPRMIKVDQFGDSLWAINSSQYHQFHDIRRTKEDYYILVGNTTNNLLKIMRIDESGEHLWQNEITNGAGYSVHETSDGGYLVGGIRDGGVCVWRFDTDITDIEKGKTPIPSSFSLSQNAPNPFNPNTMISYQLPITNEVKLSIYNLLGQRVATLVDSRQNAGTHQVEWDASEFASGIYYYRIEAGEFQDVRKMVLLR